jgi:small subunit ribosomal protein S17
MADEPTNETTEETPAEAQEEVSDTSETPGVEETSAEVSDTSETPAVAEEVSDTVPVSDPKTRSRRHVPRSERRRRTKPAREQAKTRKPITRTEKPEDERGRRQERRGVVISDKADKTIVVKVDVIKSHQRYKKVVRRSVKFHAHDEQNSAGIGDTVRIVETRPLSKQKRWRLAEIVEKAK